MTIVVWAGFIASILLVVALDLGLFHREAREISIGNALTWWSVWACLALLFNVYIYFLYENNWLDWGVNSILDLNGTQAAVQFLTGYVIELSLSVDNVFVIAMIFEYMKIPRAYQYRVLFWGVLGAIVLRGLMITAGALLIARFDWITYVFGGILILSAIRIMTLHEEASAEETIAMRIARRLFPVSTELQGSSFFTIENGRRIATPLFLTLVLVEWADVMFAVDSVPAIFAVTRDPFLVFTSNVFAILGLRTLYFVISGMMGKFRYLKPSLVFILAFVGVKMIISHHYEIPNLLSLGVIAVAMGAGVAVSLWASRRDS